MNKKIGRIILPSFFIGKIFVTVRYLLGNDAGCESIIIYFTISSSGFRPSPRFSITQSIASWRNLASLKIFIEICLRLRESALFWNMVMWVLLTHIGLPKLVFWKRCCTVTMIESFAWCDTILNISRNLGEFMMAVSVTMNNWSIKVNLICQVLVYT